MVDKLKTLLGITDSAQDNLLEILIDDAKSAVLGYTCRTALLPELEQYVIKLAVVYYNRMGVEGQTSHGEGGISRSFDSELPESVKTVLNRYIRLRVI